MAFEPWGVPQSEAYQLEAHFGTKARTGVKLLDGLIFKAVAVTYAFAVNTLIVNVPIKPIVSGAAVVSGMI